MTTNTSHAPVARTVKGFCAAYGVGRSTAYELLAAGLIRAVKQGTRTLIVEESARAWFENLPPNPINRPTNEGRISPEKRGRVRTTSSHKIERNSRFPASGGHQRT